MIELTGLLISDQEKVSVLFQVKESLYIPWLLGEHNRGKEILFELIGKRIIADGLIGDNKFYIKRWKILD